MWDRYEKLIRPGMTEPDQDGADYADGPGPSDLQRYAVVVLVGLFLVLVFVLA